MPDSRVRLDVDSVVDEYLAKGDVSSENANCQWTPNGLLMAVGGEGLAKDNLMRMAEAGHEVLADMHKVGAVHIHDLSLSHATPYCAGNSLPTLLAEGITSAMSVSKPAKHLRTAVNHIINFVGAMSNEFAGAQAFNEIDIHLAPYAYKAYLDFKNAHSFAFASQEMLEARALAHAEREVKQCIQELMFHLNFNSRWGSQCVDVDTECLTLNGWKRHDELEIGEEIYVFDVKTGKLKTDKLLKHTAYEFDGDMIHFKNRVADFLVTPDHRVVRKAFDGSKYHVELAESMLNMKTPPLIPIAAELEREEALQLTDTEIAILAWCLSDSHMEKNKDRITFMQSKKKYYEDIKSLLTSYGAEIHEGESDAGLGDGYGYIRIYGDKARKFLELTGRNREAIPRDVLKKISRRQARIFIDEYVKADGWIEENGRIRIYKKNESMISDLQEMLVIAGYGTTLTKREDGQAHSVNVLQNDCASITTIEKKYYKGLVWCPTTNTGTFVARRGGKVFITGNTPFTNITLAVTVPGDMKNSAILVAGQPLSELGYPSAEGKTYSDMGVWQKMIIDALLDTYIEGDANGNGFTFPILTINVTEQFFSMPIKDKIFELTAKFGTPYFQNFINGKSGGQKINPDDVRSMCPMHGDTLVTVYTENKGFSVSRIQDVYHSEVKGVRHKVLHNGKLIDASLVKNDTVGMKKIIMSNNVEVIFDQRHEQPVKAGIGSPMRVLKTSEIEEGMWVPFNATKYEAPDYGSREAGFVIGLFVGDGSYSEDSCVMYSLNKNTDKDNAHRAIRFFEEFGFKTSMGIDGENLWVRILGANNGALKSYISQFVGGDCAKNKRLTRRAFNSGDEFLEGLLEGWYASDGGNRGRIYTSSEQLLVDFENVCGLLGRHYRTSRGNPDVREGRLSDAPVHTLKFHTRPSYANQFFFEDGYWWFRVESVSDYEASNANKKVYCFAVDSEDHLFQLANGMVTHNCRLQINHREIQKHVGGLFGNADQTGSLQVVTVSLPFLAMAAKEHQSESATKVFYDSLLSTMETIKAEQLWKRSVVESFFKRGLFPTAKSNFNRGFDTFFTTIGFIGLWECVEILTGEKDSLLTENGLKLGAEILTAMYEKVVEFTEETGKLFNLEATPAESASYKLAKKALKHFPTIPHRGLKKSPYFTNSCHIPVEYQGDLQAIFSTQNVLQTIPSGGTVVHFYLGDEMTASQVENAVKFICNNTELPYFSMTTVYSMCEICGRIPGAHETCPNPHTEEQILALAGKRPDLVSQ